MYGSDQLTALKEALQPAYSGFPKGDQIYKLCLWMLLKKMNIIDMEKKTVTQMALLMSGQFAIPIGACQLSITGLTVEYIVPCEKKKGNWPGMVTL